jgi:hypothetical protein
MGNKHDCFMIEAIFGATVLHDSDVGDALFMGPASRGDASKRPLCRVPLGSAMFNR